ncbi:MAG TPA: hypothetical protein VNF47_08470 [Streptosporangiaceae bacterium]|nr:hypothetical protein [Streptosporangiaceae bacterium]
MPGAIARTLRFGSPTNSTGSRSPFTTSRPVAAARWLADTFGLVSPSGLPEAGRDLNVGRAAGFAEARPTMR